MSGPKTAIISIPPEPATIMTSLVAAAAIQAAMAVAESEQAAKRQAEELASLREEERKSQEAAESAGLTAMQGEASSVEAKVAQLADLCAKFGLASSDLAFPARPDTQSTARLAGYVQGMQGLANELQSILCTHAALHCADDEQMNELLIPDEVRAQAQRGTGQRLLARRAHLGAPTAEMLALAAELDAALPGERADLVASELRQRIQHELAAAQQAALQNATATIVEQSLRDLGYQVEPIAQTFFVEGGVVHFRRRDWGDYQVRLRVTPGGGSINFNVVRAVDAGNNERSVLDHIAEDRWCSEFPALLRALEARNVRLQVTRHLQAGELPVQLVERSKLPAFADETASRRHVTPKALGKDLP